MTRYRILTCLAGLGLALLVTACRAQSGTTTPTSVPAAPAAATAAPAAAASTPAAKSSANVPADGTFLQENNEPTIFVMKDGKRHAFSDWETFVAWGGKSDLSNVTKLGSDQLAAIPLGEFIQTGAKP